MTFRQRLYAFGVPLLAVRLQGVLAIVFLWMGKNKIADPVAFLKAIRLYHMLPEDPPYYLNLTAVILPWLEVVCGIALLVGLAWRASAVTLLTMLIVFTTAIFMRALEIHGQDGIRFMDIKFDCGCGSGPEIVYRKLLINLALIISTLIALFAGGRVMCRAPDRRPPHNPDRPRLN